MSSAYQFNWSLITGNWNFFVIGAWTDLWVSAIGFVLACSAGLGAALYASVAE